MEHAERNSLRAVDRAATANRKHQVNIIFPSYGNALTHRGHFGVRTHTRKLNEFDARLCKRFLYARQGARAHHRSATIHKQSTLITELDNVLPHRIGNAAPEHESGWRVKLEIVHGTSFRCFFGAVRSAKTER